MYNSTQNLLAAKTSRFQRLHVPRGQEPLGTLLDTLRHGSNAIPCFTGSTLHPFNSKGFAPVNLSRLTRMRTPLHTNHAVEHQLTPANTSRFNDSTGQRLHGRALAPVNPSARHAPLRPNPSQSDLKNFHFFASSAPFRGDLVLHPAASLRKVTQACAKQTNLAPHHRGKLRGRPGICLTKGQRAQQSGQEPPSKCKPAVPMRLFFSFVSRASKS